jgi:ribonuclease-3
VPKLDVKVSGSGASRRAAEQAAAKKALDEVMAAAPALVAKPKRSKGARMAKQAEPEIVPGVTGVQTALDLRAPDHRKAERAARVEPKAAPAEADAERAVPAPLAVIRAAHVEHSHGQDRPERADKPEKSERPDKAERTQRPRDASAAASVESAELEPGVAGAVPPRAADAGH